MVIKNDILKAFKEMQNAKEISAIYLIPEDIAQKIKKKLTNAAITPTQNRVRKEIKNVI